MFLPKHAQFALSLLASFALAGTASAAESYSATVGGSQAPKAQPLLKGARMKPAAASRAPAAQKPQAAAPKEPDESEMSLEDLKKLEDQKSEHKVREIKRLEAEIKKKEDRVAEITKRIQDLLKNQINRLETPKTAGAAAPAGRKPASATP